MKKMQYEEIELEIISFSHEDVIMTSNCDFDTTDPDCQEDRG